MSENLHVTATKAVAQARASYPNGATKIAAVKYMREATGLGIRDCIPFVDWALAQPTTTLTRATKERAVAEMAGRLAAISENAAYADAYPRNFTFDASRHFHRRQRLLLAALVRLAMARTVEDGSR